MLRPTWKQIKRTCVFAVATATAVWCTDRAIRFIGNKHNQMFSAIAGFFNMTPVGISMLSSSSIGTVILASQLQQLFPQKHVGDRIDTNIYDHDGGIFCYRMLVGKNHIGHMLNNAIRGVLAWSVAAVVADCTNKILLSQSAISNQNACLMIMAACGGLTATIFDSSLYTPRLAVVIAFGSHQVGKLCNGVSRTIYGLIDINPS